MSVPLYILILNRSDMLQVSLINQYAFVSFPFLLDTLKLFSSVCLLGRDF